MKKIIVPMECALKNSFRNYHTKGLDYLCIKRSLALTEKFYFIRQEATHRDLVVPHDHRYNFGTVVLSGLCENFIFKPDDSGDLFHRFKYETPLNGGSGFHYDEPVSLGVSSKVSYGAGQGWYELHTEIHTLKCADRTILYQKQYADFERAYTQAFSKDKQLPSLDGLYDTVSEGDVHNMVKELRYAGFEVELRS